LLRVAACTVLLLAALIFPSIHGMANEAGDGAERLEWPMLPGDSLSRLARLFYPQNPGMQRRFIAAVMRDNPAVFQDFDAGRPFAQETLIRLPDLKHLSQQPALTRPERHSHRQDMRPGASGASPAPGNSNVQAETSSAAADVVNAGNTAPASDAEAGVEALIARNRALKAEQERLDVRIAELEAAISRMREDLAREQPRSIRRLEPVASSPAAPAVPPVAEEGNALLTLSPFHLLSVLAILLAGGAIVWLRRRNLPGVATGWTLPSWPFARRKTGLQPGPGSFATQTQQLPDALFHHDEGTILVDEIESVVDEARVFVDLGRSKRAINMLEEYIAQHPHASAHPWLYLMELYRDTERREDFSALAERFHLAFNVVTPQWESADHAAARPRSLTDFPHILSRLAGGWGTLDAKNFLTRLLHDNRGGARQGFSIEVLQEIMLLLPILEMRDQMPPIGQF
jgi:hypothetical protein